MEYWVEDASMDYSQTLPSPPSFPALLRRRQEVFWWLISSHGVLIRSCQLFLEWFYLEIWVILWPLGNKMVSQPSQNHVWRWRPQCFPPPLLTRCFRQAIWSNGRVDRREAGPALHVDKHQQDHAGPICLGGCLGWALLVGGRTYRPIPGKYVILFCLYFYPNVLGRFYSMSSGH